MELDFELSLRILLGALMGAAIGYERDLHGRPAGLRTHTLVAMASASFMVVSTWFVSYQGYQKEDMVMIDPSRIAASVVTGIGFLAGGTIFRTGASVQGLTTAAGLWLVAAIGLEAGGGMYPEALVSTGLGVGVLTLMRRFEDKDEFDRTRLSLELRRGEAFEALRAGLVAAGARPIREEFDHDLESGLVRVTFDLRVPATLNGPAVAELCRRVPEVRRVRFEPLGA
jgi:putative Mg2+ transporter-C (MgtC) family protein